MKRFILATNNEKEFHRNRHFLLNLMSINTTEEKRTLLEKLRLITGINVK